jgi:hypothetical protein
MKNAYAPAVKREAEEDWESYMPSQPVCLQRVLKRTALEVSQVQQCCSPRTTGHGQGLA